MPAIYAATDFISISDMRADTLRIMLPVSLARAPCLKACSWATIYSGCCPFSDGQPDRVGTLSFDP